MSETTYYVCDRCGHVWQAPHDDETSCHRCHHKALWVFEDPRKAREHGAQIRGREARSEPPSMGELQYDEGMSGT